MTTINYSEEYLERLLKKNQEKYLEQFISKQDLERALKKIIKKNREEKCMEQIREKYNEKIKCTTCGIPMDRNSMRRHIKVNRCKEKGQWIEGKGYVK